MGITHTITVRIINISSTFLLYTRFFNDASLWFDEAHGAKLPTPGRFHHRLTSWRLRTRLLTSVIVGWYRLILLLLAHQAECMNHFISCHIDTKLYTHCLNCSMRQMCLIIVWMMRVYSTRQDQILKGTQNSGLKNVVRCPHFFFGYYLTWWIIPLSK